MTIRAKLRLTTSVSIGVVLAIGGTLFFSLKALSVAEEKANRIQALLKREAELGDTVSDYLTHHERRTYRLWLSQYGEMTRMLGSVVEAADEAALFDEARQSHKGMGAAFDLMVASAGRIRGEAAGSSPETWSAPTLREMEAILGGQIKLHSEAVVSDLLRLSGYLRNDMVRAQQRMVLAVVLSVLLLLAVNTGAYLTIMKGLVRPVDDLRKGTEIVGAGDLDFRIGTDRRDEIGGLSRSFDAMADKLKSITVSRDVLEAEVDERLRAQEALSESEERFRIAAETSNDVIYEWDLKDRVDWFGDVDGLLGYGPGEFPRTLTGWSEFLHPEDRCAVMASIKAHLEGRAPYIVEYRMIRKDGVVRWWSARGAIARAPDGAPSRWIGTITDITERKNFETSLRESEDKFKYIFEHSVVAKSLTLPSGVVNANKALADMLGYSPEELREQTWQRLSHPDDEASTAEQIRALLSGEKESARFTKRYVHKNGSIVWGDVSTSLRRDSAGRPLYFMTSVNDVTERRRAEEQVRALNETLEGRVKERTRELEAANKELERLAVIADRRQAEEQFRTMANSIPQLAWIAKADGYIFWYNQRWYEYTGTTPEQMEGWGWQSVHDPNVLPQVMHNWTGAIASGKPFDMEFPLRGTDGRFHTFLTRVQPFRDSSGRIVQWFGTNTDVEPLKQAEEEIRKLNTALEERVLQRTAQLEAANKELEAFSYSVSHDLRAPLRAMDGFSCILQEDHAGQLDAEGKRLLGVVRSNTRQMGQLIDDLLSFSRVGRQEMKRIPVDMKALAELAFRGLGAADGEVSFSVGALPRAEADPALMRQAWANLISNAVKFTGPKARRAVEVEGRTEADRVVYSVKDNGVGFDMAYANKLFSVFQRLHSSKEFEGTGVGLALVKRIVQRHGGEVWAEGKVGEGATFSFSLPRPGGST